MRFGSGAHIPFMVYDLMASRRSARNNNVNKRRKGIFAVIVPWAKRFGIGLVCMVLMLWLSSWLLMKGHFDRAKTAMVGWKNEKLADAGFKVEDILVEGRVHTDGALLLAILNTQKGDPLFAFDPAQARAQIETLAWTEKAHVERRWPGTIYIRLEEREPLAFLQQDKKLMLLDTRGGIIETQDFSKFKNLLVLTGEGAQEGSPDFVHMLAAEPEIYNRAQGAQRVSGRRWDIVLKNGVTIKLPEEEPALALRQLVDAQGRDQVLDKDIEHIDLRDQTRMIIRTRPGAVQEYKASLKPGETI